MEFNVDCWKQLSMQLIVQESCVWLSPLELILIPCLLKLLFGLSHKNLQWRFVKISKFKILRKFGLVLVILWNDNLLITFWSRVKRWRWLQTMMFQRPAPLKILHLHTASLLPSLNALLLGPSPLGGRTWVAGNTSGKLFLKCNGVIGRRRKGWRRRPSYWHVNLELLIGLVIFENKD